MSYIHIYVDTLNPPVFPSLRRSEKEVERLKKEAHDVAKMVVPPPPPKIEVFVHPLSPSKVKVAEAIDPPPPSPPEISMIKEATVEESTISPHKEKVRKSSGKKSGVKPSSRRQSLKPKKEEVSGLV